MKLIKFVVSIILLVFITSPSFLVAQPASTQCIDLKDGVFYAYPKYSLDRYVITRTEDLQQEINTTLGDTAIWKVNWVSACAYTLQFISGTKDEASMQVLYKRHKMFVNIFSITDNYYLYKSYRDSLSDIDTEEDTIWIKDNLASKKISTKKDIIEASFPGGNKAWTNYITEAITDHIKSLSRANKTGTCYISFIVDKNGAISAIEALTMEDTELAKISVAAIKNGPKWKPAYLNGKAIKAYRIQPVTFTF